MVVVIEPIGEKTLCVRYVWAVDFCLSLFFPRVTTSALNQAVKRNHKRFPERFMFQLTDEEFHKWKSQIVISKMSDSSFRMGLRTKPYVFTEHGVTMLAAVLKSQTAINRISLEFTHMKNLKNAEICNF